MGLNRLRTVICLGAVLLLMAGVAMAGTTTVAGGAVKYAREVGVASGQFTLPAVNIPRVMDVVRTIEEDFFVDVTLQDGAHFGTPLTSAALSYVPIGSPSTGAMHFSIFSGGTAGSSYVRFLADMDAPMTEQGSVVISTLGWTIHDVNNRIGTGQTIGLKVETFDAKDGVAFDVGGNLVNLMTGAYYGVVAGSLTPTTATIDVAADRKLFLAQAGDTTSADNGASLGITIGNGTLHRDGNPFSLTATSTVVLTVTGDMSGISNIFWQGLHGHPSGGSVQIVVPGSPWPNTNAIQININTTTPLDRRILHADAVVVYDSMPDVANGTRDLSLGSPILTTWLMNGTVLYTNWTNGNNAFMNGRLYVWNPSSVAGAVTAEVFTLPVGFGGSTLLGEMELGVLPASSGINLRVAEDILTPLGITLPYITNGGNLFIRLTINAAGCTGLSNVFNATFSYGAATMVQAGIVE